MRPEALPGPEVGLPAVDAAQADGAYGVLRFAIAAMGTRFELALHCDDARAGQAAGELAIEEIRQAHDRLSAFAPGSLISAINRRAGGEWTKVDPATFGLLMLAAEVCEHSGGAFDITLGPLMRAWGFRRPAQSGSEAIAAAVEQARQVCGMNLLALDVATRRVALAAVGAQIDLGAIAKGHALDLAGAALRECGIRCALLHAGTSTTLALGEPPGHSGWKIALGDRGRRLGPIVMLRDQALSVSSPAGRTVEVGGSARAHVLDPRSGAPTSASRYAAAIFPAMGRASEGCGAAGAALADAWSTALLVCARRPEAAAADLTSLILSAAAADPAAGDRWSLAGPGAAAVDAFGPPPRGPCAVLEEISA